MLEGALGVGAATAVGDGRDLAAEQRALVLVRAAGGDVIDARHHVVLGREGHDGHARGRGHHGEVGQQLTDELELAEEVGLAHAGRLVHQEDELQALAELPQPPHASPESLAQPLHFALLRRRVLAGRGRSGQPPRGLGRGLGEEAEAEIARRGQLLKGRPARNERQTPATKGQARPHCAGDGAAARGAGVGPARRDAQPPSSLRGVRGSGHGTAAASLSALSSDTGDTVQPPPAARGQGMERRALATPLALVFSLPSLLLLAPPEAYKMFEGKGAVKKNLPLPSFSPSYLCLSLSPLLPLSLPLSLSSPFSFSSRVQAKDSRRFHDTRTPRLSGCQHSRSKRTSAEALIDPICLAGAAEEFTGDGSRYRECHSNWKHFVEETHTDWPGS